MLFEGGFALNAAAVRVLKRCREQTKQDRQWRET